MSRKSYAHLVGFALDHPWAITPGMLRVIAGIIGERIAGHDPDPEVVAGALAARRPDNPQPARGGVALIAMHGVISPRQNMIAESSGGTSFEALTRYARAAADNPDVKTIVFDVDSPGGSAAGAAEFAAELRAIRARKPIIAQANHQMASAAYWVMANATKIHASPSALVGSVGVYTIHNDLSEALAKLGIKREYLSAGKYKIDGNETAPLSESAREHITALLGHTYDHFVGDVAKGRGVTVGAVRNGFGEGRVVTAEAALEAGMVDSISTLDDTIARLLPAGASVADYARSLTDTSQEPHARATDQDRRADLQWQREIEGALLEWQLTQ
jgi:signal peptide peptidase SppA